MASERDIYNALVHAGFSMRQAAGIMGNMQNESGFNVETHAMDSNGFYANGLISWNEASYPDSRSLVTGNQQKDLADQIKYLKTRTNGFTKGIQGGTAEQVASNWAEFVEVCQGCAPGGAQNIQRQANARTIFADAQKGKWPKGPGIGSGGGSAGGGGGGATTTDFLGAIGDINSFFGLLSSADFWERIALVMLGAILVIVGIVILASGPVLGAAREAAGVTRTGRTLASIGGSGGGNSGPSPEVQANRAARLDLARRNTEIGERKVAVVEQKERRLSTNVRKPPAIHKSGKPEPNPSPAHS